MCKNNNSNKSSPHKSSLFTYDYDGDDPDLWTPPRKKKHTVEVEFLTNDKIFDLKNTGKFHRNCNDLLTKKL